MSRFALLSLLLIIGYALPVLSEHIPLPEKRTPSIPLPERRPDILDTTRTSKQDEAPGRKNLQQKAAQDDAPENDRSDSTADNTQNSEEEENEEDIVQAEKIPLPVRHPGRNTLGNQELTVWPAMDILKARQFCDITLKDIPVTFEPSKPLRKGRCGTPAPIRLKTIGQNPVVTIKPFANTNCQMAKALNVWIEKKVQPAARKYLNTSIVGIKNIASFSCRHRYNDPRKRISEHAFANALDIAALITADGRTISLLDHWGPTQRDLIAAREAEKKRLQLQAEKKKKQHAEDGKVVKVKSQATKSNSLQVQVKLDKKPKKEENPTANDETPVPLPVSRSDYLKTAELDKKSEFLRVIHDRACGIFGTVLGPEANEAHRNHFHFDLAPRKYGPFCE